MQGNPKVIDLFGLQMGYIDLEKWVFSTKFDVKFE
jgi:hypothetical protein